MSETNTVLAIEPGAELPAPEPLFTDEGVRTFISLAPDKFFDQKVTLHGPNGDYPVIIDDALYKRQGSPSDKQLVPIVKVIGPNGNEETYPASSFLRLAGLDDHSLDTLAKQVEAEKARQHVGQALISLPVIKQPESKAISMEEQAAKRAKVLFAPLEEKEGFNGYRPNQSSRRIRKVTPASIQEATKQLRSAMLTDPEVEHIIKNRPEAQAATTEELTRLLRTNANLRVELGSYLLAKLRKPENKIAMAERVCRNDEKSISDEYGVSKVSSEEYTSMLALSMLDGTFNSKDVSDYVEYNRETEHGGGQHRYSAQMLLDLRPANTNFATINDMFPGYGKGRK